MSSTFSAPSFEQPTSLPKLVWEDPCLTLERVLEAQAQGGPPTDSKPQWAPNGFLGPLDTSGGAGVCT